MELHHTLSTEALKKREPRTIMVPHPFPRLPIGHSVRLDAERPGGFVNKHHQDGVSNFSFDHWTYTKSRESMSAMEQLPSPPHKPRKPGPPFTEAEESRRHRRKVTLPHQAVQSGQQEQGPDKNCLKAASLLRVIPPFHF